MLKNKTKNIQVIRFLYCICLLGYLNELVLLHGMCQMLKIFEIRTWALLWVASPRFLSFMRTVKCDLSSPYYFFFFATITLRWVSPTNNFLIYWILNDKNETKMKVQLILMWFFMVHYTFVEIFSLCPEILIYSNVDKWLYSHVLFGIEINAKQHQMFHNFFLFRLEFNFNWTEVSKKMKNIIHYHEVYMDDTLCRNCVELLIFVERLIQQSTPKKEADCTKKLKDFGEEVLKVLDGGPSTASMYFRKKRENIPLIKILFRKKMFKP